MNKILLLIIGILIITLVVVTFTKKDENVDLSKFSQTETNKNNKIITPEISNSKKIDLSNQGLNKIPEYVFTKTNIEELNVSNNNLTGAIQAEIRQLSNLKVLNASNNKMTGVPAEIGQLANLEILDLSNNQITGLSNELGNLKKLKVLNLSGNEYSKQDLDIIKSNLPKTVNIITN